MPEPCGATMVALFDSTHTHTCSGVHDAGDHMCSDPKCRRWFYQKGNE